MKMIFLLLSFAGSIAALVCAIIILIDAFKNAVWKGLVGLICGFYLLYYAFTEFQNDKKMTIIGGWLGGIVASVVFSMLAK